MYGNFDKKAYLEAMEEEYNPNKNKRATITISMEEYKELLIIKGKYEELKSQQSPFYTNIKFDNANKQVIEPYKVTCGGKINE